MDKMKCKVDIDAVNSWRNRARQTSCGLRVAQTTASPSHHCADARSGGMARHWP